MSKINEEFEVVKASLHNGNEIADIKSNPVIESVLMPIIKAFPVFGDMIDSTINLKIDEFQNKKEQELVEVILKDKYTITSEMVNDVEFIMNFAKTREAVRRLATNDKVKYFGNLIRNGYLSGEHIENNEFEEYLEILNSLSYRELDCLVKYYEKVKEDSSINEAIAHEKSAGKQEISEEDERIIFRLIRTGFVEENMEISFQERTKGIYRYENKRTGFIIDESFERFYKMVLRMNI